MSLAIVILAAGRSRRMRGTDKLAQPVDGTPLLSLVCARAQATGCPVWVALPGHDHPRAALLPAGVAPVAVRDADRGMGRSVAAAIAALPEATGAAMILPADMPDLTRDDLAAMIGAYGARPDRILRATSAEGRPGHPVIFPRAFFGQLRALGGDQGARAILSAHPAMIDSLALPGHHALTDLDTPEDWARWRAARDPG